MTEREGDAIIDEVDDDIQDADGLDVDDRDIARDVDGLDDEASAIASMREMIVYIARALASNPDAVSVTEEDGGDRIYLHLSVDDQDKGKVIGRDGRVAQSMRSLLRVAAVKAGTRVSKAGNPNLKACVSKAGKTKITAVKARKDKPAEIKTGSNIKVGKSLVIKADECN